MQVDHRRICRSDFANARIWNRHLRSTHPECDGRNNVFQPVAGIISRAERRRGNIAPVCALQVRRICRRNAAGTLRREKASTYRIIVNNRAVDLPVLEFSGRLVRTATFTRMEWFFTTCTFAGTRLRMKCRTLFVSRKSPSPKPSKLETSLEKERKVDVYGIYFDFASDAIRPESEPILKEIADVLARNAEWTLSNINPPHRQHRRRQVASLPLPPPQRGGANGADRALCDRAGPPDDEACGDGASQPKATNDTIVGARPEPARGADPEQ